MKKHLWIACCLLYTMNMAAQSYTEADTLWTDTAYGVIKQIDTESNVATVRNYARENPRLVSVQHVVASGEGQGLFKGKQLFFDEQGKVASMPCPASFPARNAANPSVSNTMPPSTSD